MKTIISFMLVLLAFTVNAQETNYAPGRLLLSFKKDVKHYEPATDMPRLGVPAVDALCEQFACSRIHAIKRSDKGYGGVYVLDIDKHANIETVGAAYMATGLFKSASPDYFGSIFGTKPDDTLFGKQWSLDNDGSFADAPAKAGADIDMLRAWDIEEGDSSVVVAVLDAGAKLDHPDFAGRIWSNKNEIPFNNIDDDNNGYIDDTLGWNFFTGINDASDENGHGTHVMGILGANANNTTGYAGIDRHCKLMVCRMTNAQGLFNYAWILEALYYAVDMGANAINISAGGYMNIPEMQDAVDYAYNKNVTIVAGMGNNASASKFYPAACNHVIAVGATTPLDTTAFFSNYGKHISVVAPGVAIYGLSHLDDTATGVVFNGTSQATPHVTGIASLLFAQDRTRTPDQIKDLIQNNAEDLVGSSRDSLGFDIRYGYGRVNAYRALTNAVLKIEDKQPANTTINLYPNPANAALYLQNNDLKPCTITITNIAGQQVYQSTVNAYPHKIELQGWASGVYMASVETTGGKSNVKLVVE